MKKMLILLLAFAGSTASGQVNKIEKKPFLQIPDSVRIADRAFNCKFLNNGTTLLNVRGSFPEHLIASMGRDKVKPKFNPKPQEELIAKTLLFTGRRSDYLSKPFIITPNPSEKAASRF